MQQRKILKGLNLSLSEDAQKLYSSTIEISDESKLPFPIGHKILVAMPKLEEKRGGIIMPPEHVRKEEFATIVGKVIRIGPDAYEDASRFSSKWCSVGDWVLFRSYAGTKCLVDGVEYRIINDDTVEAIVSNPNDIARAV